MWFIVNVDSCLVISLVHVAPWQPEADLWLRPESKHTVSVWVMSDLSGCIFCFILIVWTQQWKHPMCAEVRKVNTVYTFCCCFFFFSWCFFSSRAVRSPTSITFCMCKQVPHHKSLWGETVWKCALLSPVWTIHCVETTKKSHFKVRFLEERSWKKKRKEK